MKDLTKVPKNKLQEKKSFYFWDLKIKILIIIWGINYLLFLILLKCMKVTIFLFVTLNHVNNFLLSSLLTCL